MPIPLLAAAAIPAAASIASSVLTNNANQEQSNIAYDRQMEILKYQNEYNSPLAQMERYKNAGLNPNLIYGSGSASAGNMSYTPEYKPALKQYNLGLQESINTYSQLKSLDNTLQDSSTNRMLTNIQAGKVLNETITETAKQNNLDAQTAKTYVEKDNAYELGKYISQVQEANLAQMFENTKLLSQKIESEKQSRLESQQKIVESKQNVKVKGQQFKNLKEDYKIKGQTQVQNANKIRYSEYGLDDSNMWSSMGKTILKNVIDPVTNGINHLQKYFK